MSDGPPKILIRKRSDRKLSVILSFIAWVICLAVDWLVWHLFHVSNPISSAFIVVTLCLLNAFGGFTVWRRLSVKEKWIIGRAIIASAIAMVIVPFRVGPFSVVSVGQSILSIALGAYFALPVQRLVIVIEREVLNRALTPQTDEDSVQGD